MSTVQLEVHREEAPEEEIEEIERIRKKYKERQKLKNNSKTIDSEKQALIKQAQQQEQQEKEQLIQKYKQRLQHKQENTTFITTSENEDSHEKSIDHEATDRKSFGELFEKYNIDQEIESDIQLENDYLNNDVDSDALQSENRDLEEFEESNEEIKTDDESAILEDNYFNSTLHKN
jgi:hypothetical protein